MGSEHLINRHQCYRFIISCKLCKIKYWTIKEQVQRKRQKASDNVIITVADPGFPVAAVDPVGEGAPTSDTGTFRQKNKCQNERIGSGVGRGERWRDSIPWIHQ